MPTYTYLCAACGHRFDAVQSIHDDGLDTCPECQGALRKVFGTVGVSFRGSGFYRTDSRAAAHKTSTTSSGASSAPAASTGATSSGNSTGTSQ